MNLLVPIGMVVLVGIPMAAAQPEPQPTRPDQPKAQLDGRPAEPGKAAPPSADTPKEWWQQERLTGDWWGARSKLEDKGIEFDITLIADWSMDVAGGRSPGGTAFRHLLLAGVQLDTEKLGGWKGGTGFLEFQQQNGEPGSNDVGDWQGVGSWDADGLTQIGRAWYEQKFADDVLRIKVGKIDANYEFAYTEYGLKFINGSASYIPTCLVLPTYPDPAFGGVVFWEPGALYAGAGAFDGSIHEGVRTGAHGPAPLFSDPADMFYIGEAGLKYAVKDATLPGRVYGGGWWHTGTFERRTGGTKEGTGGLYTGIDQAFWRESPGQKEDAQGLGGFFQLDCSESAVSQVDLHIAAGLVWTGPIPGRDRDEIGAGASWVRFARNAGFSGTGETNIEAFYRFFVTPAASVTADLQNILNPGGANLDDAWVWAMRLEVKF